MGVYCALSTFVKQKWACLQPPNLFCHPNATPRFNHQWQSRYPLTRRLTGPVWFGATITGNNVKTSIVSPFAAETGDRIATVDLIIWRAANLKLV